MLGQKFCAEFATSLILHYINKGHKGLMFSHACTYQCKGGHGSLGLGGSQG